MARMIQPRHRPSTRSNYVHPEVPPDLRKRLEATRLDLLAFFRTLDRCEIAQDLPGELKYLFELDADCAEALWALDQPPGRLDFRAMARDTLAALKTIAAARQDFLEILTEGERRMLAEKMPLVLGTLHPREAYNQIPDRDPSAR